MPSRFEPADEVEIRILVDNATDMLSSNPPFVESESALSSTGADLKVSAAKCLCCAVHGLSCLVTAIAAGRAARCCSTPAPRTTRSSAT